MTDPTPLHRLFGLSWTDYLQGTGVTVETEVDLSLKQQFLDLILIRKGAKPIGRPLPDGFEHLASYNLVTFKSHQESLDGWSLCELIGHYVNYRKQISPSMQELLPARDFRLYAVCVRQPRSLISAGTLQLIRPGVYDAVIAGLVTIRVIVVHQLPQVEHNAMLQMFSINVPLLRYATDHYRPSSPEISSLIFQLFRDYQKDPRMAPELKQFARKTILEMFNELSPQERLEGLTPEERLDGLTPEERLDGLTPEERLNGLTPRELSLGKTIEELKLALKEAEQRFKEKDSPR